MKMWKSFFLALKIAEQNNLSPRQCGNVAMQMATSGGQICTQWDHSSYEFNSLCLW